MASASLCIDYAFVDGNTKPDFHAAKAAGARVIIPRGAYGRPIIGQGDSAPIFLDPVWDRDKSSIVSAGLKRSAYLFVCMPRTGYTTPEPEIQAEAFADYVMAGQAGLTAPGPNYCGDYPPVFDVEEQSTLSPDAYFEWILRVALVLRRKFGAWPIMYSSQRVWAEYLKNRPPGELANCPQWVAKPWPWPERTPAHLDGAAGYQPDTIDAYGDATNWLWYQYQGDAIKMPGFSSTVDLSRVQVVAQGAKGDIVKDIQARVGVTVDGDYGPATAAGVKAFQSRYPTLGTPDGIVGAATWAPLTWQAPASCAA